MKTSIKGGLLLVSVLLVAGCVDLKPLQQQVDDLKTQVSRNESNAAAMKSAVDSAAADAAKANQAAAAAQSSANQAVTASQASQSCCDATNEKIERMFRRSVSK